MSSQPAEQSPLPQPQPQPQPQEPPSLPGPVLTLSKCLIRPFHPSDAPALQRAADSPLVARYMSNLFPSPYTLAHATQWIAFASVTKVGGGDGVPIGFAICDTTTTTTTTTNNNNNNNSTAVVGGVGIAKPGEDVEAGTWAVGYWLGESAWGKGIMTEALCAYVRWLFERFPQLRRLQADVLEGNEASVRVLRNAGFVYEGARRKAAEKNGTAFDVMMFGLLREECLREN